jgi:ABC-2 type transport system permease protein
MFLNILYNELKLLNRSKWLIILFSVILLLFTFASYNGSNNVSKRLSDIADVKKEFFEKDSVMLQTLYKIKAGENIETPYWRLPSEPMIVGNQYPRLAIMYPESLSFLSTGQSDMYTHFISPRIYGNNFALDYSEMVNPVQLLFGNFDLAFVIIYILPLLIIAFTYNALSKEKELGTFRVIASQPISTLVWLFHKISIRFFVFTFFTSLILVINISIFSFDKFLFNSNLFGLLLLLAGYNLFWFVLAFIINIKINDSSKNSLTLIGLWLLLVLIIPATINQVGSSLYPIPSRLKMINEIRSINKENESQQNEIMDSYLRSHPEFVQENNESQFGFWHNYFASEKAMEEKTKPLLQDYDSQLKKQQVLIEGFRFLSPAILMQQSLNKFASTSELHYNDFKKQVFEFSDEWRNYLIPMLFKNQKFNLDKYDQLPSFKYNSRIEHNIWLNVFIILTINIIMLFTFSTKNLEDRSV